MFTFSNVRNRDIKTKQNKNMVRVKYRYIVVQIIPEDDNKKGGLAFTDISIAQCIMKNVQKFYGDFGAATVRSGFKCKYCNEQTRIAIIRIKHRPHRYVTSVLPLITTIGDHLAKFRTLYNGATIMHCQKFIVNFQRNYLDQTMKNISVGQQKELLKKVMNIKGVENLGQGVEKCENWRTALAANLVPESASGFSTPPTASADTCDSGFTEFFSKKAGTSSQQTSRASENKSEAPPPRSKRGAYSTSDSESDSRKTEDAMQCLEDDSYDGTESEETDFQTKEKIEFNRMNYRWIDWCNRQIVCGVNPRTILRKIFPNEDLIFTSEMSDRELWTRIVHFVSQPPARTRLYDINSMDHVVRLLTTCKNIIVLTGAGVSVSCGIPDFRSRSGIYARLRNEIPEINDPHEIFDIRFFSRDPRPFFKFAKELYPGSFTPSLCHRFIRLLERKEKLLRNFSQNIDTLERLAGIERVVECHGSFATASCTKCGVVVTAEEIREDVLAKRIPMCAICNPVSNSESSTENQAKRISCCTSMTEGYEDLYEKGILKPDIVFFGESLPESFHPAINADRQLCDCLLVIGSSLKVRPVSLIPEFLKADVPQILINRERVGNYIFDVELLGDADIIVNQICRMIGGDWTEICEQPELSLSATLEFNPETTETVNLPLTRTVPVAKNKCESNSKYTSSNSPSSCQSPTKTTEDTQDVKASPTELSDKSPNESLKCRESSSTTEPAALTGETINVDDTKLKKAFVFSVENVYIPWINAYVERKWRPCQRQCGII
ncbi:NAD-dependent histone deacetylase sirtuin-1 [Pseudolycoriella hygida]|uniref:NAD-dependent histone deacetylase sirtuin-1 n=1 Tax=Pseudolycoriella hygida TaxID=35572 RepID=A0A9Q0MLG3_9DIPT|nr:NAD-dependent histone deacetylase sirtuin-1 [Pseudolycoriella hygida]